MVDNRRERELYHRSVASFFFHAQLRCIGYEHYLESFDSIVFVTIDAVTGRSYIDSSISSLFEHRVRNRARNIEGVTELISKKRARVYRIRIVDPENVYLFEPGLNRVSFSRRIKPSRIESNLEEIGEIE